MDARTDSDRRTKIIATDGLKSLQSAALSAIIKLPESKQIELLAKYAKKYGVEL